MSYSSEVLADSPLGYWRMGDASGPIMTDSSGNSRPGFYFGMGSALATISSATASSTLSGYPASNMIDGNSSTFWHSDDPPTGNPPQWVQLALASATVCHGLEVTLRNVNVTTRGPKDYEIRGSNDSTFATYTTLASVTGDTTWTAATRRLNFANSTAYQYYRLHYTATTGEPYVAFLTVDLVVGATLSESTTGLLTGSSDAAVALNGSSQYAVVSPYASWMDLSTEFSVEFILKPTDLSATRIIMGRRANPGTTSLVDQSWDVRIGTDGKISLLQIQATFAATVTATGGALSAGVASHVVVTFNAGTVKFHINGTEYAATGSAVGYVNSCNSHLVFGADLAGSGAPGSFAAGTLDEVAYYSTALSATRAAAHYAAATSSSSPVSVSAPVLAVVEAVPAPVVTAGVKVSVAAPVLAIAVALLAPTVTVARSVSVAAPTLAVVTTVPAPTVTLGSRVAVAAPVLPVTFAVPAPTVTVSVPGVHVTAPVLSLITAIPAPTITGVSMADRAVTSLTRTPVGVLSVIPLVPSTELDFAVPVTRTSVLAPVLSAAYPAHPEQGHEDAPAVTRATVGYVHLWIDGQDVTYFRGAMTTIRRWESEAPFGDTVAAFELPQLNPWDVPGSGDLAFLRPDAPVSIGIVDEYLVGEVTVRRVRRLWTGFLDARGNGLGQGEDYAWEAKGTMWSAQHQIREPYPFTEPVDIGVMFARTMNAVEGRTWRAMPVTPIGITTMNRGSRDESAWDYLQALLSEAVTDDGRQWTVTQPAVGIFRLALKPAPTTVHATVAYGTPGVDIDLRVDESTRVDRIYGRGITSRGGGWANVFYPALELLTPPPWPNGLLDYITLGDTDADTLSGTGVTDWQRRVDEFRAFANPPVSGVMSAAWVAVIDDVQRFVGVTADGSLGPQTWAATFDRGAAGIDMRPLRLPLASKPSANKWLYTAAGVKTGPNPAYDPRRIPREIAIDFGPGKTKAQGRTLARILLGIYGNAAASGQIVWTFDPNETDRTRLSHLSNVKVKGFEGSDRVLQVSSKSVELEAGEDGPVYVVTTRVDERARDAMAVEDMLEQRRSAQADPSRNPATRNKASRAVSDQRTPWDSESPCGVLRRTAVNGASGLWTVVTIPFAEVGKLAGIRLHSDRAFAFAIFASLRITENKLASIVGNPFVGEKWRDAKDLLDEYGIIEAWGEEGNGCGYSPKTEADGGSFTGDFVLDTPVDYWTETPPYVSVAIFMRGGSGWISGEFIPAYEP